MDELPFPQPTSRAADVAHALAALARGDRETAGSVALRLSRDGTGGADLYFLRCELALANGRVSEALAYVDDFCKAEPANPFARIKRADVLLGMYRRNDARDSALSAAQLDPGHPHLQWAAGRIIARSGDPALAATLYKRASDGLSDPSLLYDLATTQFFAGLLEDAEGTFDKLLKIAPAVGHAAYFRSIVRRQTRASNHLDELRALLRTLDMPPRERAGYFYAIAKELEDLGEDADAFAALTEGARLMRSTLAVDTEAEVAAIRTIAETFTREALEEIGPGWPGRGAIFVVGMPRTGTTLLEHLLAKHGGVASAGELPDFGERLRVSAMERVAAGEAASLVDAARLVDFADLGRQYIVGAREAAGGASTFVDKMPVNFMYCGLIAKALPHAHIVHVVRDPMDTCLAVYRTLFANAYPFSYELGEIARYFSAYRATMRHWNEVLPGKIIEVRYEDLVSQPERATRAVLDGCGIPWRDTPQLDERLVRASMTASSSQVRQPVHTRSIGNWKRYEGELEPLRRELAALGVDS